MFPFISRKRLAIAGVVAAMTAGGAAGALLAGHATAQVSATSSGQGQSNAAAVPSPSPGAKPHHPGKGLGRQLLGGLHLVKVVTINGQQLTVADSAGTQTTYTVATNAKVSGPKGATETLGSLKPGELVVIVTGHKPKPGGGASPAPSPSPGAEQTVTIIRDTGFVAA